jgi:hypothetical protein
MHVIVYLIFFYTVSYRNLKLSIRFFWRKLHIEFAFRHRDHFGSGVTCPLIFFTLGHACNRIPGGFLYRLIWEPETFHDFFWVKLHIDFAVRCRDHYGSRVTCHWIFYNRMYACNSFLGCFTFTVSYYDYMPKFYGGVNKFIHSLPTTIYIIFWLWTYS